jgi:hypothetical protein
MQWRAGGAAIGLKLNIDKKKEKEKKRRNV